jgi:hypothetical protein
MFEAYDEINDMQLTEQDCLESAWSDDFLKWCKKNDIDFEACGDIERSEIREDYFDFLTNEKEEYMKINESYYY